MDPQQHSENAEFELLEATMRTFLSISGVNEALCSDGWKDTMLSSMSMSLSLYLRYGLSPGENIESELLGATMRAVALVTGEHVCQS